MTSGSEEDKAAEKMGKVTQELGRWQVSVDCFVSYCIDSTLESNQRHIKFFPPNFKVFILYLDLVD